MPLVHADGTRPEYYLVCFDKDGHELREADGTMLSDTIVAKLTNSADGITDVFVMSHGWKGDVPAAREQYDNWSAAMAACTDDRARVRAKWPNFKALNIGFHWPSQPWGDEKAGDGSFAAGAAIDEDAFVADWSSRIAATPAAQAALRTLFREAQKDIEPDVLSSAAVDAYRTLDRESGAGATGVAGDPGSDKEPFDPQRAYEAWSDLDGAVAFDGGIMAGLLSPLRQVSFWTMKKRAQTVGEGAGSALLQRLSAAKDGVRIHLMGHSFGCIVMSSMLRGLATAGKSVSTVLLVQGAMSLWSYATSLPDKPTDVGYFRPVIDKASVTGPLVVTTSRFDRAVGWLYPKAAGLFRQVAYDTAAPTANLPKYGAIGTFGIQGAGLAIEARNISTNIADHYDFKPGHIYNVNADAVIKTGGGF